MLSRDIKRNGGFAFFISQGTDYQMHFIREDQLKRKGGGGETPNKMERELLLFLYGLI
jgi:hypothetical protein